MSRRVLGYVGVACVAAAAGALFGILWAPNSGRETRRRLIRKLEEEKQQVVRKGQRAIEKLSDRLEDQLEEGRRMIKRAIA